MIRPNIDPPNQKAVSLVELLESAEYQRARAASPLTIALGQNTAGQTCVYDLSQAHILVGGTTGAGKSNFIDSIICSIIAHSTPNEVQVCLLDYAQQHNGYKRLPHLYEPAVLPRACGFTAYELNLLDGVISEMTTRFERFRQVGARYSREVGTLSQYHKLQQEFQGNGEDALARPLPALVVLIDGWWWWDEDRGEKMKRALLRLLPMAHGVGIHVVVAETHPEVIPDAITSYIPMRIAFQCTQQSYQSLLLSMRSGAENLEGRGDMLVQFPESSTPERIHAPLVTHEERARLVNAWVKRS